jgi:hypothetical protein
MEQDFYASFIDSMQESATPSLTASSKGSPHSIESNELFPAEWMNWQDAVPSEVIEPGLLSLGKRKLSFSDLDVPESEARSTQAEQHQQRPRGKQGKTSHNVIEKRYRSNLNDKILDLRDAVPHLLQEAVQDPTIKQPKGRIISCATAYIKQLEATNKQLVEQNAQLTKVVTRRPTTGDRVRKLALGALAGAAAVSGMHHQDGPGHTTHALGAVPLFGPAMSAARIVLLASALWFLISAAVPAPRAKRRSHDISMRVAFQNAEEAIGVQSGLAMLQAIITAWLQAFFSQTSAHVKTLCEAQVLGADLQISRGRILAFAMLGKQSTEVRIMQLVLFTRGWLHPKTVRSLASRIFPAAPLLTYAKLLSDEMQAEIVHVAYGESTLGAAAVREAECKTPSDALLALYAALSLNRIAKICLLKQNSENEEPLLKELLALPLAAESPMRLRILLLHAITDTAHFQQAAEAMQSASEEVAAMHVNVFRCATILRFGCSEMLLQRQYIVPTPLELFAYLRVAEGTTSWKFADRKHKIYLAVRAWAKEEARTSKPPRDATQTAAALKLGTFCVSRIKALMNADDSAYDSS